MSICKNNILGLPATELEHIVAACGQPAFRARQLFGWLHEKRVESFGQMTNLPLALREGLEASFCISLPKPVEKQHGRDGTVKYLLELDDGNCVEAVLMRYKHGNSLCVSSQVGCRMGCRFCASTKNGLVRNLTAAEILGQVYAAAGDTGETVSHVVLMGIGEPLDNMDNVLGFIELVTHSAGYNMSVRNISLSTCGLAPQIRLLAKRRLGVTLSVSLHSAFDDKRSSTMPVNRQYPIAQLMEACRDYYRETGRRVSFEYAMLRGVNDSEEDARALAGLLRGMGAHVNLIPVNPVDGSPFTSSDRQAIAAFQRMLAKHHVNATVRRRLGGDIDAACGQLRARRAANGDKHN